MQKYIKISVFFCIVVIFILSLFVSPSTELQNDIVNVDTNETIGLFYAGKIEPVVLSTVSSPIEGKVKTTYVHYGDKVKKGTVLFELQSNGDDDKTLDIIVDYLKNRDQVKISETKLKNEKKLLDAGIIAQNEYDDAKQKRDIEYIEFVKAKTRLEDLAQIIGVDVPLVSKISLDDIPAITNIMKMHHKIPVTADNDGVFLQGSVKDLVPVLPGVDLKKGIPVGVIADTDEVKINISVPEIDINKLKLGQEVNVTGPGFKGITLVGKIFSLNLFDFSGKNDSGEVTYPVTVIVPNITDKIRHIVHVGMSSKVAIIENIKDKVFVPLNSVHQEKDGNYVTKFSKDGKKVRQKVSVGRTTTRNIEILSGLKSDERVRLGD
jgi:HlyD family secretion protein